MTKKDASPTERIEVTITYLEQLARPALTPPVAPATPHAILRCEKPPATFYRYMFNAVGEKHHWASRRYLPDDELLELIHQPTEEIYVLYRQGWPAGFAEISFAEPGEGLIRFFGLVPEAQGERVSPWFFYEILRNAWSRDISKLRIETCTEDSPAALILYQKMGFEVTHQGKGLIEWRG